MKNSEYTCDFTPASGYGWADCSPDFLRSQLKKAVSSFKILSKRVRFDAIAFTGSSGACIAFVLAYETKIPLMYVRKPGEKSHGKKVESNGRCEIKKYLIVDDFIDTGTTIRKTIGRINKFAVEHNMKKPTPVGVFLFDTSAYMPKDVIIDKCLSLKCWSPNNIKY